LRCNGNNDLVGTVFIGIEAADIHIDRLFDVSWQTLPGYNAPHPFTVVQVKDKKLDASPVC
jgi:hypothetical protein